MKLYKALLWRSSSILTGMAVTCMTNALCLWLYAAIINGAATQVFSSVISLIIFLIIAELGVKCMRNAIVGLP